jgi:hypothetical protein
MAGPAQLNAAISPSNQTDERLSGVIARKSSDKRPTHEINLATARL